MASNRFQPILIAGLLPLLVFTWFGRDYIGQIDFWLLWLVAMTLVGLPLVFAEIGLAHRSGTSPLIGLAKLTREADVATAWRGFGWLTVGLLLVVIGHLLASSGQMLQPLMGQMALPAMLAVMTLGVLGLSFAKHLAGWLAVGFGIAAMIACALSESDFISGVLMKSFQTLRARSFHGASVRTTKPRAKIVTRRRPPMR